MLAEPRRKQKWSVDPRNTQWTRDESKFGHKMLEKMGWSKGKGLGANEDGNQDPIKIKQKNNSRGVGCTASYENNWVAHQDDFASLLADLNKQNSTEKIDSDLTNVSNLEEKSKFQKKRVHYKKFTKGKDLSRYKNSDMNAIFGSSSHSSTSTPTVLSENESSSSNEAEITVSDKEKKAPESTNNITSQMSYQEYFAMKLKKLKKSQEKQEMENDEEPTVEATENTETEIVTSLKPKNKKSKKLEEVLEENSTESETPTKKRKKKDKKSKSKSKKSKTSE